LILQFIPRGPLHCSHLHYQIPQITVNCTVIHQRLVIWQPKFAHTKPCNSHPLRRPKALSQTKSCHTTPQNYPSDKLDPEEVKRTGRWTCKKIEANTGDNILSQQKLSRKLITIYQRGKYSKNESALSYKLSLKVKKNSQCRISSSHQTPMVSQHLTNLSKLAKLLPLNLIFISKICPTSDSSILRPLQLEVYSITVTAAENRNPRYD
jgi:hypothetical protein